jgi:hypothetical protein
VLQALARLAFFLYTIIMKPSIPVHKKKRGRGRPATGFDPAVTTRLPVAVLAAVEKWAAANDCKRAVAIARLVELGLTCGTVTQVEAKRAAAPKRRKEK